MSEKRQIDKAHIISYYLCLLHDEHKRSCKHMQLLLLPCFGFASFCVKLKCYCVYNASRIIEVALRKYTNYPVGRNNCLEHAHI